ncbi:hypothetical protein [Pseudanabaena sp. FACHB-2040]|uniref:hypothetical protein n=1 Tax=Pseudanabaena sp. FACHB-2040 TaxID=2692859 RepID=UPI001686E2DE|nr:hypothetical protein [Pseudanabaena sp. FACHB-2040]MBD2260043.1 hypothetical protein [Pseudanabaena sp. FACHB-2040]
MFQSSDAGAPVPPVSLTQSSDRPREKVDIVIYGSLEGCDRSIKHLHLLGYAEPNDWSDPIPTGRVNRWMVLTTKHLLIE